MPSLHLAFRPPVPVAAAKPVQVEDGDRALGPRPRDRPHRGGRSRRGPSARTADRARVGGDVQRLACALPGPLQGARPVDGRGQGRSLAQVDCDHIGEKAMASVTREDIEACARRARRPDPRLRPQGTGRDRISAKTAQNVWASSPSPFPKPPTASAASCASSPPTQPSASARRSVGAPRRRSTPINAEFLAVASSCLIPLEWRELHALAAYTYARPGELQVLDWSDVDLKDRKIRITRAWDYKNDRIKSTKTGEARTIPIEPQLLPLLERMRKRARGTGSWSPRSPVPTTTGSRLSCATTSRSRMRTGRASSLAAPPSCGCGSARGATRESPGRSCAATTWSRCSAAPDTG